MQTRKSILISLFLVLASFSFPETILIKNASIYLPSGEYQAESFILIKGSKLAKIGMMKDLGEIIPDRVIDVAEHFVYPAFIDSYYTGLIKKPAKTKVADSVGHPGELLSPDSRPGSQQDL